MIQYYDYPADNSPEGEKYNHLHGTIISTGYVRAFFYFASFVLMCNGVPGLFEGYTYPVQFAIAATIAVGLIYSDHKIGEMVYKIKYFENIRAMYSTSMVLMFSILLVLVSLTRFVLDSVSALNTSEIITQYSDEYLRNKAKAEAKRDKADEIRQAALKQYNTAVEGSTKFADEYKETQKARISVMKEKGRVTAASSSEGEVVKVAMKMKDDVENKAKNHLEKQEKIADKYIHEAEAIEARLPDEEQSRDNRITWKNGFFWFLNFLVVLVPHLTTAFKYQTFSSCNVKIRTTREEDDAVEAWHVTWGRIIKKLLMSASTNAASAISDAIPSSSAEMKVWRLTREKKVEWAEVIRLGNNQGIGNNLPNELPDNETGIRAVRDKVKTNLKTNKSLLRSAKTDTEVARYQARVAFWEAAKQVVL